MPKGYLHVYSKADLLIGMILQESLTQLSLPDMGTIFSAISS